MNEKAKAFAGASSVNQKKSAETNSSGSNANSGGFNIDEWLKAYNVPLTGSDKNDGAVRYIGVECPKDSNHKDAAVIVQADGALGFKCFHDSCADLNWRAYRQHYEPDAYNKAVQTNIESTASNRKEQEVVLDEETSAIPWPETMDEAAFIGLVGRVAKDLDPYTEADIAATLSSFLVAVGNVIYRSGFFEVSGTPHYTNLFVGLVGRTAGGRKGTSWGLIKKLLDRIDPDWATGRVVGGLSSGEGLVWQVRDEVHTINKKGEEVLSDAGETDKRLLVIESELARSLKAMKREGNTLSAVLREAWDGPSVLRSLTKNDNTKASDPHISIIGHITRNELRKDLEANSLTNGLANRFLWFCVRRSKLLPLGGGDYSPVLDNIAVELKRVIEWAAENQGCINFSQDAASLWCNVYPALSGEKTGVVGPVLARAEAQVRRLAVLYAVLDCSETVDVPHLKAALAVFAYCEKSTAFIFGGEPEAYNENEEKILAYLRDHDKVTQTTLNNEVFKKRAGTAMKNALEALSAAGKIGCKKEKTEGAVKATKKWFIPNSAKSAPNSATNS